MCHYHTHKETTYFDNADSCGGVKFPGTETAFYISQLLLNVLAIHDRSQAFNMVVSGHMT